MKKYRPVGPMARTVAEREAMRQWLSEKHFTHFITLSINDPLASRKRMWHALHDWDAKVNSKMLGKRWRKKIDERTNWIAFKESQEWHPHWHLLMQILPGQDTARFDSFYTFEQCIVDIWREVSVRGTCNVQYVEDSGVVSYVTKQLGRASAWEDFIISRELYEL